MSGFKTLRGMRDLLPEDAETLIRIQTVARRVACLYGYREIITPVVESYDLLAAKAGDEVRSRMFKFKDLGGRDVALRPEFTASVARLVATTYRNEPKPFRIFCMGSTYRYDPAHDAVVSSVTGSPWDPWKPQTLPEGAPLTALMKSIAELRASLTFTKEGLRTDLTIRRSP